MTELKPGVIFGLGNPLLDICAPVDYEYLKKWDLEPNNAILAEEKHKHLPQEIEKLFPVKFLAGGSCQNTMRIAQWVLKKCPKACVMMGCISNDFFGKCMQARAEEDGINCQYLINPDEPTGLCSVLITDSGKNRSMVADLGAANHFKKEFLLKNWNIIENARICYATGFHLTVCPDAEVEIAKHCSESKDKLFAFNLSAPFIMNVFGSEVDKVIPYANCIFGNEAEAQAYADLRKWETKNQIEIARLMANEKRANENKRKVVMLTQGAEPVVVALVLAKDENPEVKERVKIFHVDVPELKKEDIIDTNTAGDAFVGGFLGGLILNNLDLSEKSVKQSIKLGCYTAREIIMQDGCTIPQHNVVDINKL